MTGHVGQHWRDLDTPVLVVELDRLEQNLTAMQQVASSGGASLRPHFKTHKSVAIARRQMDAGAIGMCVATLDEAQTLIDAGITDILLAVEVTTPIKLNRVMELAGRAHLTVAVDDVTVVSLIDRYARDAGLTIDVSIEVDSGLRRCGVLPEDAGRVAEAIRHSRRLRSVGVFTHGGHAYGGPDLDGVRQAAHDEAGAVTTAADTALADGGLEIETKSVGSTPTILACGVLEGVTEIRPGNYVFGDAMQVALGVMTPDHCALSVIAAVMSTPASGRAVVDAGAKTMALDRGAHGLDSIRNFGARIDGPGSLVRLSEEHGIMEVPADGDSSPGDPSLGDLSPGDLVRILPNHACTVSNLGRKFHLVRDDHVEEIIPIDAAAGTQ